MDAKTVLENILTFSIGTISVSACVVFIAKAIFNKWMDLSLEKYKSKLNLELEEFKIEKQRISDEYKVKFTKLHEERAEVIKELYSIITEIELGIKDYMDYMKSIKEDEVTRIYEFQEELYRKLNSYSRCYKRNKILFKNELSTKLDNMEELIVVIIDLFELDEEIYETEDSDNANRYIYVIHNLAQVLNNNQMKSTKDGLEIEFKKILGV